jgi:hypothetical protein
VYDVWLRFILKVAGFFIGSFVASFHFESSALFHWFITPKVLQKLSYVL